MRKILKFVKMCLVMFVSLIVCLGCLDAVSSFASNSKSDTKFVSRIGNKRKGLASISQNQKNFPKQKITLNR